MCHPRSVRSIQGIYWVYIYILPETTFEASKFLQNERQDFTFFGN